MLDHAWRIGFGRNRQFVSRRRQILRSATLKPHQVKAHPLEMPISTQVSPPRQKFPLRSSLGIDLETLFDCRSRRLENKVRHRCFQMMDKINRSAALAAVFSRWRSIDCQDRHRPELESARLSGIRSEEQFYGVSASKQIERRFREQAYELVMILASAIAVADRA